MVKSFVIDKMEITQDNQFQVRLVDIAFESKIDFFAYLNSLLNFNDKIFVQMKVDLIEL